MNFLRPPARQPRIDDEDSNTSTNAHFASMLDARVQRRSLLRGSVGGAATALFGSLALTACGGSDDAQAATNPPVTPTTPTEKLLGFAPVAKSLADTVKKRPGGRFGVWGRRRQRGLRIPDPTPISYAGALCEVADRPEVTGSGFKVKT